MGNWWWGYGCQQQDEDKDAQHPMLHGANALSSHDQAVLELKVQRDRLREYQKKIAYVIERENELARQKLREGKKKQALLALKKRKYQEHLLDKTQTQLDNLHDMVESIEFARMEATVFEGLRSGNRVLNEIHSEISVEAVEDLMADTRAALQHQEEVEARLSEALSPDAQREVEEELAELQASEAAAKLPSMPAAGAHEPVGTDPAQLPAKAAASPQSTKERAFA